MSGGIDLAALPEGVRTIMELAAQLSEARKLELVLQLREMVAGRG